MRELSGDAFVPQELVCNICDPIVALLLLATDGVPVGGVEAPAKLQRAIESSVAEVA
jgi:hypothetical protein